MKDILVEFTEKGAVIHKDPLIISAKKSLPHCFLNPDLSKVSGISPSYWDYSITGQIIPASKEKVKNIDEQVKSNKNIKNFNKDFLESCIKKQQKQLIIHRVIIIIMSILLLIGVIK
jgi:hypothetical protein